MMFETSELNRTENEKQSSAIFGQDYCTFRWLLNLMWFRSTGWNKGSADSRDENGKRPVLQH